MEAIDIDGLVSQAEKERVTLAEVMSRTMTSGQIDELQDILAEELAANYGKIEDFMKDVKVASLEELMELQDNGSALSESAQEA